VIIAIDGPAGAGKSTVARALASRLGFQYLDSGAMYRSVALGSLAAPDRDVAQLATDLVIELGPRVLVDGRDVSDAIRSPEVSERASQVATIAEVRSALVAKQRQLLASGDWVAEGRDIGTVVAPHAQLKVFLTASPEVRSARRGEPVSERDTRDATRALSPLRSAGDAVVLDTTDLTMDGVVERIAELAAALPMPESL
jgi:cytidylate kinase